MMKVCILDKRILCLRISMETNCVYTQCKGLPLSANLWKLVRRLYDHLDTIHLNE